MSNDETNVPASAPTAASTVVRLAAVRTKDRTAAKRMRKYRKRKASKALVLFRRDVTAPVTVCRDADVPPTVTQTVTATPAPSVTVRSRKAPSNRHLSNTVTGQSVTVEASRSEVDLIALRADIHEWVELHKKIAALKDRARRSQRRSRVSDQVCRFLFLGIGVAFFVMLGLAALAGR
jgi:hypothetical protein